MDTHTAMQTFARVVELGSFAAAADKMGQARSVVTRQIAYLEEKYGVRLLNRTTRKLSMTDAGRAFYERVRPILAEVADLELSLQAEGQAPSGRLRVSAPVSFGILHLGPAIAEYLLRYPDVIIDLDLNDRVVDLVEDGYDVAVRIGPLQDSSLVGRQIALMPQVTVASPAYLARYGEPATLDDLEGHRAVDYISSSTGRSLPLDFMVDGRNVLARPGSVISVNGAELYASAALAGLGLAQVPRYRVADELASGRLRVVLPDAPPAPMPVSVLYPQNRQVSARVRVFSQWLAEIFGQAFGPAGQTMPVR